MSVMRSGCGPVGIGFYPPLYSVSTVIPPHSNIVKVPGSLWCQRQRPTGAVSKFHPGPIDCGGSWALTKTLPARCGKAAGEREKTAAGEIFAFGGTGGEGRI